MKKLKIYEYKKCDTCRKALRFLDENKISYEALNITTTPPSKKEIETMLGYLGDARKLFNTSGLVYKEMKLSEKIPQMKPEAMIRLLAGNGRLIKRPFLLGEGWGLVGFKSEAWMKELKKASI